MHSSSGSDHPNPDYFVPTIDDIRDAARQLSGHAVRTPLLESPLLNELVGGRVLVKAEVLQRTGSFKFRGAYNHISRLNNAQLADGVVAYSSGNHAQGVAAAATLAGTMSTIIMPANAPALKISNTQKLGAKVITYDRDAESREKIGEEFARETGARLVRPYDDPWVIAGQGTTGLEIAEQCRERNVTPDVILSPAGGGGLIAGTSLAAAAELPGTEVLVCEPVGFEDHVRSLRSGNREKNVAGATSICDALLAPTPGELTFSINRENLAGGYSVTDDEVRRAMVVAFTELKIVVEPGGAATLAAILAGKYDARDKTVVAIASGGNVDPEYFADVLGDQTV
jgi:threonine dehydratase